MAVTAGINEVFPWGRSLEEYARMFRLGESDLGRSMLGRSILGCGDGPASFNAELTKGGGRAVSCDPLYRFSGDEIRGRIERTRPRMLEGMRRNREAFVWDVLRTPEEVCEARMAAMELFLCDYDAGRRAGRYVAGALPSLPFSSGAFELGVCSHLLFLYSEQLSAEFHVAAMRELCRVAGEVRVFPLVDLSGRRSCHVDAVAEAMRGDGLAVQIEQVPYEFQRSGNMMMRVCRSGPPM